MLARYSAGINLVLFLTESLLALLLTLCKILIHSSSCNYSQSSPTTPVFSSDEDVIRYYYSLP